MSTDLPEPDRVAGAPHPRETPALMGQESAERAFLDAFAAARLHHGWLLTGPRGVGKATLAWRIARFLLATPPPAEDADGLFGAPPPPDSLDIPEDHPVARRVQAMSEPGLFLLRRGPNEKGDRLAAEIRVAEVRRLKSFLTMSAADGGRRVVIVDAADEMNTSAANALLKLLEEPPARTTLLLICHNPARLLPTIRSRCRELRLAPLDPEALARALGAAGHAPTRDEAEALAELSGGSVGAALRLVHLDGLKLYQEIMGVLAAMPDMDRAAALKLAERIAARGQEERLELFMVLLDTALGRLARSGVAGPPARAAMPREAETLGRLAPDPAAARAWAEGAAEIGARLRHGRAVNLDMAGLVFDSFARLSATASAAR